MEKTEKITNIGRNIVTIIIGIITIIPFFKSASLIVKNGLSSQIPSYWVIIIGVSGILLGYFIRMFFKNETDIFNIKNNEGVKHESVYFKYSKIELINDEWSIKSEQANQEPKVQHQLDSNMGDVLDIKSRGSYYMDFLFKPNHYFFNNVTFLVKLNNSTGLYVNLEISNIKDLSKDRIWFRINYSGKYQPPRRYKLTKEWIIYGNLINIGNGWSKVETKIEDELSKISELSDYKFERLRAIRLRGDLSISEIKLTKK